MDVTANTLEDAIIYAAEKHRGQRRKGDGRPYILHPLEVLITLYEVKVSKHMYLLATAAVLHDVSEDCDVPLEEIAKRFGFAVAALVEELTLDKSKYETVGKTKLLCEEVLKMSSYALCLKLIDRYRNIKDMKKMTAEFVTKYVAETWEIVKTVKTRKLTATHKKLLKLIEVELNKY